MNPKLIYITRVHIGAGSVLILDECLEQYGSIRYMEHIQHTIIYIPAHQWKEPLEPDNYVCQKIVIQLCHRFRKGKGMWLSLKAFTVVPLVIVTPPQTTSHASCWMIVRNWEYHIWQSTRLETCHRDFRYTRTVLYCIQTIVSTTLFWMHILVVVLPVGICL